MKSKPSDIAQDLELELDYSVKVIPNGQYYTWTLALSIILAIVVLVFGALLCILIFKYKKAKTRNQE